MAKINVTVRLDSGVVEAADRYAAERRGWNRTTVVEAALEGFLDDVGGGVPDPARVPELEEEPVPSPPASPRAPEFSPAPDFGPLVRRGSDVLGPEPNVDRFERTDDYRRAMALYRERRPWEQLMKARQEKA